MEVKSKKDREDLIAKMIDCDCKVDGLGWGERVIGCFGGLGIFPRNKNTRLLNSVKIFSQDISLCV